MADLTFTATIPDDKMQDLLKALRYKYKMPNATAVELRNRFQQDIRFNLRREYIEYMRDHGGIEIDIT